MNEEVGFNLDIQVKENRKKFRVDHFDMVISDYVQRITSKELILNPPYQRLFRWDDRTQSQLIESILIGIPIPPIFVFQNNEAKWEVIDGVQRTTTLFNYLCDKSSKVFSECDILTELNNKTFKELPENLQRIIKNTRIRIELVEETDDIFSQYLLFNRLNSNGEKLGSQEIRNFLIYKLNKNFYKEILRLSKYKSFKEALAFKETKTQKQEDVEYVLKFFLCREFSKLDNIEKYDKIEDLITKEAEKFLLKYKDDYLKDEYEILKKTFDVIYKCFGKNSFRYYQKRLNNIANTFSMSIGISFVLDKLEIGEIKEITNTYFKSEEYNLITSRGYSPTKRLFELSKHSVNFFKEYVK